MADFTVGRRMAHFEPMGFGWLPSAPDYRDYTPSSPEVEALLRTLGEQGAEHPETSDRVDLREYFLDADDQLGLNASTAHAVAAMAEYFERRATGKLLRPSRLFLYQNALRLRRSPSDRGSDLRTTLASLVRCGAPPERHWPYDIDRFPVQPDAFLYSFRAPYDAAVYVRLDVRKSSGELTLRTVKAFLAAGFPVAFGFGVPSSLGDDGMIPYRPTFDSIIGHQAVLAVGYDDRWLSGSRGALLVRNSWGRAWGESGYGWLPYVYVEEQLAVDFWTLLHPDWVRSGEFDMPLLRS
jgi:C1A family cysteine protease